MLLMLFLVILLGYFHVVILSQQSQLYWGTTFDNLAPSENVKYECTFTKNDSHVLKTAPKVSIASNHQTHQVACNVTKIYVPSHYENQHFEKALELHNIKDQKRRTTELIAFLQADIDDSFAWLARVKEHMSGGIVANITTDDVKYLSRFEVTKTCTHTTSNWIEWIEPITVHMRHPFAMGFCPMEVYTEEQKTRMNPPFYLQNLDYLIVQSGAYMRAATSLPKNSANNTHSNNKVSRGHTLSSSFLFNAGTSTFQSSLRWFLCAYSQRKASFNRIYGYEATILEPIDFWQRVPKSVKSSYHFYNTPLRKDPHSDDSPLALMAEIATPQDFVSFKLDVDDPSVEIPIAMEVLRNPKITWLVDEFFFELHFRCEIMMSCGWGNTMPAQYGGLQLDRLHAMQYFRDLREIGVRAHVWP